MSNVSRREFVQGALALTAVGSRSLLASTPDSGLILTNGRVATLDRTRPFCEALSIRDGRIVRVGTSRELLTEKKISDRVIDLGGRTVIPGLNDSHLHFVRGSLSYNVDTRWDGVSTLSAALAKLSQQAARTPQGQWVRVGGGFSEFQFAEKRMPTIAELNKAVPDRPAYVLHFYQSALVNKKALEVLGYTRNTPDPAGGYMERDKSGTPTGALIAHPYPTVALAPEAKMPQLSFEEQKNSIRQFMHELNRLGMTSVTDPGGVGQPYPDMYKALEAIIAAGQQTLRLSLFLLPQDAGKELDDITAFIREVKLFGNDRFQFAGAGEILVADGMDWDLYTQPRIYPANKLSEQLKPILRKLVESNWPFRQHATFNQTITDYLDIYESVNRDVPLSKHRWLFDHAELATPDSLKRVRDLGGGIAVQHRMAFHGEYGAKFYGKERMSMAPPVAEMIRLGIPVGAGTDATRDTSYNPWICLHWLTSGKTVGGLKLGADSNLLDRTEALRLYTQGSAWVSGEQDHKGTLQPGRLADLAVLSEDYFNAPEETIPHIKSSLTIVGGEVVYAEGPFAHLAPAQLKVEPSWSPVAVL